MLDENEDDEDEEKLEEVLEDGEVEEEKSDVVHHFSLVRELLSKQSVVGNVRKKIYIILF